MGNAILEVALDILKFVSEYRVSYMEKESFTNLFTEYHGSCNYTNAALTWLRMQGILEQEHYLTRDYYKFNHTIDSIKTALIDEFEDFDCSAFFSEHSDSLDSFSKKCLADENCKTVEDYKQMLFKELRKQNKTYKIHGRCFTMLDKDACDIIADDLLHFYENIFRIISITSDGNIIKKG